MPPKESANSLRHFDDRRPPGTPVSLMACAMEGVLPDSLVRSKSPDESVRAKLKALPLLEQQKHRLVEEHREQERLKSVALVKKRHSELLKEDTKQSVHAHQADEAGHSSRRRTEIVPGAVFHKEINDAVAADTTVAEYFYRQAKLVEAQAAARLQLEEKTASAEARLVSFSSSRENKLQEKARKNEEHLQQVLQKQQHYNEEMALHKAERVERLAQKFEKVTHNAEKNKQERTKQRKPKVDPAEVENIRRKKLEELEAKLERHAELARERLEHSSKEKEVYDLKVNLKRQVFVEQKERTVRARECNKEHIRQQLDQEKEAEAEARYAAELAAKQRSIIRDTLHHQREEVDRYLQQHHGELELAPPDWLTQRASKYLRDREKEISNRKPSVSAKEPSGAQDKDALSPRRPSTDRRPKHNGAAAADDKSDEGTSNVPRPPKDAFSISSPRISDRQSFPRWMFE